MANYSDKANFGAGFSLTPVSKTAKTAAYTAKITDGVIFVDATAGIFTVTLPLAAADAGGTMLVIKAVTATANIVTVTAAGADTIDGAATSTLIVTTKKSLVLQNDCSTKWFIVAAF